MLQSVNETLIKVTRLTYAEYPVFFLTNNVTGAEYGAVTALGINTECTRLLCGHARGQVI